MPTVSSTYESRSGEGVVHYVCMYVHPPTQLSLSCLPDYKTPPHTHGGGGPGLHHDEQHQRSQEFRHSRVPLQLDSGIKRSGH